MPRSPKIHVEKPGPVAVLWIENPPRNVLSLAMITDLAARVPELEKDDGIRAVVVAGAEHTNFSAGIDMEEWAKLAPKDAQEWITRGQDAFWALEHLTKPTVAAIAGSARGAGAELALACDIRIADETALFSHPEVELAWMPSHGGTARLSKIVGRSKALEILTSGKDVKALDALRLGIVNHLAAPGQALAEAQTLAGLIARKPRNAVKAIKRALTEGDEKPYRNRFLLESQHAVQLLWTEDYNAAMAKLRERRA
ncbi:MAG TPA: enoyl-CoA hydratase/isomerase family protein [Thermoplasmata archaeon]|nr:enoyl-CoA hydratase/isomerase family protein [Thermoplasmata archaeon]